MRTKKWYMRLFYHMLDMTIINSWLLYKRVQKENGNNAPMKLKAFRIDIATCLTKVGQIQTPKRGRPTLISIEEKKKRKEVKLQKYQLVRLDLMAIFIYRFQVKNNDVIDPSAVDFRSQNVINAK
ncbi:unnamed protein product [Macrosiphum euphorbiae]|uniref:PiggyBac transposable element-derived protein domain-containing protein n=1 Tax=Macrosiphum euphorbiae TaxID=13131 RepID=A0AAV0XTA2_9HEMI|nr:unnamed protein product [Macrosiphum euphorbiae]